MLDNRFIKHIVELLVQIHRGEASDPTVHSCSDRKQRWGRPFVVNQEKQDALNGKQRHLSLWNIDAGEYFAFLAS